MSHKTAKAGEMSGDFRCKIDTFNWSFSRNKPKQMKHKYT